MLITDDIFQAFLQCETKAHLKLAGSGRETNRRFPRGNATVSRPISGTTTYTCALIAAKTSAWSAWHCRKTSHTVCGVL